MTPRYPVPSQRRGCLSKRRRIQGTPPHAHPKPRSIPPSSASPPGRWGGEGTLFFPGSGHGVDGGKQVPGKYLPAGACGDAAFTGFTASKPLPQSLQISFHHFIHGLITRLAAGAGRLSQVQPPLNSWDLLFKWRFSAPVSRSGSEGARGVQGMCTPKPGHPEPLAAGVHALSRDELLIKGKVSFPASSWV